MTPHDVLPRREGGGRGVEEARGGGGVKANVVRILGSDRRDEQGVQLILIESRMDMCHPDSF